MIIYRYLIFCLLFCLIIFANNIHIVNDAVYAEENTNQVIVSVLGYGKVDAVCDQAEIHLTIQNVAESFSLSQQKTNNNFEEISSKIKEIDNSAEINLGFSTCYPTSNNGVFSYHSSAEVTISTTCIDCIDKIIETFQDYTNVSFYGINYSLKNKADSYNNALMMAKENAKQKASTLYSNATLIDLYEVDIYTSCYSKQNHSVCIEAQVRARFQVDTEKTVTEDNTEDKNNIEKEEDIDYKVEENIEK